jgi:hypothetical protein
MRRTEQVLPPLSQQMSGWFMTPEQALEIKGVMERHGMSLHDVVERVLAPLGEKLDTYYLYSKVMWQGEWLVRGFPPERAPYRIIHRKYGVNPLRGHLRQGQLDMSIDEFVEVHLPAAFGEAA